MSLSACPVLQTPNHFTSHLHRQPVLQKQRSRLVYTYVHDIHTVEYLYFSDTHGTENEFVRVLTKVLISVSSSCQLADVGCAVHLCVLLHRRYSEFSALLLEQLQRIYSTPIKKEDDRAATVTKYRLGLRLLGEVALDCLCTCFPNFFSLYYSICPYTSLSFPPSDLPPSLPPPLSPSPSLPPFLCPSLSLEA